MLQKPDARLQRAAGQRLGLSPAEVALLILDRGSLILRFLSPE